MNNTTVNLNDLEVKFIIDAFINKGVNASNVKPEVIKSLNDKNLNASVVLAVGYRADNDETQNYPKVRYSREQIITHI